MIRPAFNVDSYVVTQLVYRVLTDYGLKPDPLNTDADLNDIEGNYPLSGGSFDVLEDSEGDVIGCVGLYAMDDGVCELRKMYVKTEFRGKGHGKKLLRHAIRRARQLGFRKITLETAAPLKEAIALYGSHGFEPYDAPHLSERCDQAFILDLVKVDNDGETASHGENRVHA